MVLELGTAQVHKYLAGFHRHRKLQVVSPGALEVGIQSEVGHRKSHLVQRKNCSKGLVVVLSFHKIYLEICLRSDSEGSEISSSSTKKNRKSCIIDS